MRSWLTLAVMLAVTAGLGAWLALRAPATEPMRVRVAEHEPQAVRTLALAWPDGTQVTLEKADGGWRIVAPHAARADAFLVERALTLLDATSEVALPATELARFDLAPPRVTVSFDEHTVALGALHPLTGGLYVRRGDAVLLLEARYAGVIPQDPAALNDKRLLAPDERPTAFVFPDFTVRRTEHGWRVTPDANGASQDEILNWVEGWQLASALRAEPFAGAPPATRITLELADGRRIPVSVMERDGEIAFSRHDERMRYTLFPKNARRLLAPPAVTAEPAAAPR